MTWNGWNTETARCTGFFWLVSTSQGHSVWLGWGWGSHPGCLLPSGGKGRIDAGDTASLFLDTAVPLPGTCSPIHHAPHHSPASGTWLISAMLSGYWARSLIHALLPSIKWENMHMLGRAHKVSIELASFYKWEVKAQALGTCSTVAGDTWELVPNLMAEPRREPREFHAVRLVASLVWKDRINPAQDLTFSPCTDGQWWRYQAI